MIMRAPLDINLTRIHEPSILSPIVGILWLSALTHDFHKWLFQIESSSQDATKVLITYSLLNLYSSPYNLFLSFRIFSVKTFMTILSS